MTFRNDSRTSRWADFIVCSTLVFLCTKPPVISAADTESPARGIEIHSSLENRISAVDWFSFAGLAQELMTHLQEEELSTTQWKRIFPVTVDPPNLALAVEQPAMAGHYQIETSAVRFTPRFPLSPGNTYRATFNSGALPQEKQFHQKSASRVFRFPKPTDAETTSVSAIYPTTNLVPENLLKFYIHFSAPMSGNQVHRHLQLINEKTGPVELPFLELDDALWNRDMTQLTLFIDPGRIKREVKPLEDVGPSLVAGHSYRLVIDENWLDANGNKLAVTHVKQFEVEPPDRSSPEIEEWVLTQPRSGSFDPLFVNFGESLDHALAQRMIHLETPRGRAVEGSISLGKNETLWTIVPDAPWASGEYVLVAQTTIEDLAGNNIGKLFEVDLRRETGLRPLPKYARRRFTIP